MRLRLLMDIMIEPEKIGELQALIDKQPQGTVQIEGWIVGVRLIGATPVPEAE